MFKYSKGNNRTLIYSFPPRKSFPLLGSSLLLARFPLSPGSFAQGNTAVFSYSSLLDPACYKGSARGQGATEGSKQMATARVEWIKGWKPPRCFWSHPTHQDLPEMPQGGWGALGPELIPHYMVQLLCLTLQSFRCPGSTRPPPIYWRDIHFQHHKSKQGHLNTIQSRLPHFIYKLLRFQTLAEAVHLSFKSQVPLLNES